MTDLFSDLKRFLREEQEVFGDFFPREEPATIREAAVHPPKPPVNDEPLLFDLPKNALHSLTTEPWGNASSLKDLDAQIHSCLKCPLGQTRTKFVFGVGNPQASLMLIGEAPGADEDAQGEPFVGRAGQLLNKVLAAINFQRGDVYICNILKCRPPGNRTPAPEEVEQCMPYLKKQIDLVKPKLILCLGLTAIQNLLGVRDSLGNLRGKVLRFEGTPVMVTYHPAALLRNPNWKAPAWEDVQAVRKLHDQLVAAE
jgi:uracil-DNA glycosylase